MKTIFISIIDSTITPQIITDKARNKTIALVIIKNINHNNRQRKQKQKPKQKQKQNIKDNSNSSKLLA